MQSTLRVSILTLLLGMHCFTQASTNQIIIPKHFKIGVGDSAFQTEGVQGPRGSICKNNWTVLEDKKDQNGSYFIKNNQKIGNACNRWDKYKKDIHSMAEAGFDMYRTSIEWSKVEPEQGKFNQDAIDHYVDVCKQARAHGMEPIITLFHHTWPDWFDKLGDEANGYGFENKQNIKHFLNYCMVIFNELNGIVKKWIILNEPAGYAIQGWWRGQYPPFKKNLGQAGKVLNNLLNAHVQAYHQFKKIDPSAEIGIAKIFQPIEPHHKWNLIERAACNFSSNLMHDATLTYFKTGKFTWGYLGNTFTTTNKQAIHALDFIGINYYTHTVLSMSWTLKPFITPLLLPEEKVSDDNKAVYAQGLRWAIEKAATLNIPMYVMENGIADRNDRLREHYIKEHLAVTLDAAKTYDVRGYFYWTFMDNFEWRHGYDPTYGLYSYDRKTQERKLRKSSAQFIELIKNRK